MITGWRSMVFAAVCAWALGLAGCHGYRGGMTELPTFDSQGGWARIESTDPTYMSWSPTARGNWSEPVQVLPAASVLGETTAIMTPIMTATMTTVVVVVVVVVVGQRRGACWAVRWWELRRPSRRRPPRGILWRT